jgi:hypothetical protein
MNERSFEPISDADLARLCEFALIDLAGLVERNTFTGRRYRDRLLCIACARARRSTTSTVVTVSRTSTSGASSPPVRPDRFRTGGGSSTTSALRSFTVTRTMRRAFSAAASISAVARSRSQSRPIQPMPSSRTGRTETARRLSENPVVLLWPDGLRGRVIWAGA